MPAKLGEALIEVRFRVPDVKRSIGKINEFQAAVAEAAKGIAKVATAGPAKEGLGSETTIRGLEDLVKTQQEYSGMINKSLDKIHRTEMLLVNIQNVWENILHAVDGINEKMGQTVGHLNKIEAAGKGIQPKEIQKTKTEYENIQDVFQCMLDKLRKMVTEHTKIKKVTEEQKKDEGERKKNILDQYTESQKKLVEYGTKYNKHLQIQNKMFSRRDKELKLQEKQVMVQRRYRRDMLAIGFITTIMAGKLDAIAQSSTDIAFLSEDIHSEFGEISEILGSAVAPIFESVLPIIERIVDWVDRLPDGAKTLLGLVIFLGPLFLKMAGMFVTIYNTALSLKKSRAMLHTREKGITNEMAKQAVIAETMKKSEILKLGGGAPGGVSKEQKEQQKTTEKTGRSMKGMGMMMGKLLLITMLLGFFMEPLMPLFEMFGEMMETILAPVIELVDKFVDWLDQSGALEKIMSILTPIMQLFATAITAIIGIVASFIDRIRNSETAMKALKLIATLLFAPFKLWWEVLKWLWNIIKRVINALFGSGLHAALEAIKIVVTAIYAPMKLWWEVLKWLWDIIKKVVTALFGSGLHAALEAVKIAFELIMTPISTLVGYIETVVMIVFDTLKGVIDAIGKLLKGDFSGAWDSIKGVFSKAAGRIKSFITDSLDKVKNAIGRVIDKLREALGLQDEVSGKTYTYDTMHIPGQPGYINIPTGQRGGLVQRGGFARIHKGETIGREAGTINAPINIYVQGSLDRSAVPEIKRGISEQWRDELRRRAL